MGRKPKIDKTPEPIDLDPHELNDVEAGKDLTHQEKVFCYEYVRHGETEHSVLAAGWRVKYPKDKAHSLLKKEKIKRYIAAITKKHLDKYEVTEDRVIQEIAAIAFQDIKDVVDKFNEHGVFFKNLDDIDGRTISAIDFSPMGETGYGSLKVRRPDKQKALETLLNHLQRVKEYDNPKPTMTVTPNDLQDKDASQCARAYQDLIRMMQK